MATPEPNTATHPPPPAIGLAAQGIQLMLVLLLSFVVFHLDAAAYYAVLWLQGVQGGLSGLTDSLCSGAWLWTVAPLALLIFVLYPSSNQPIDRFAWALAPTVVAVLLGFCFLALSPPILRPRFERWMKAKMPAEVAELRCKLMGVGIAGGSDKYSFTCSREETERLIREMKVKKREFSSAEEKDFGLELRNWPGDCSKWPGVEIYIRWEGENDSWYYELITDVTHTKVNVKAGRN